MIDALIHDLRERPNDFHFVGTMGYAAELWDEKTDCWWWIGQGAESLNARPGTGPVYPRRTVFFEAKDRKRGWRAFERWAEGKGYKKRPLWRRLLVGTAA